MGIYFLNVFSILIYSIIIYVGNFRYDKSLYRFEQYEKKYSHIVTIIVIFQLFFLSVFKNINVGNDTLNYANEFLRINGMSIKDILMHRWETGYVLFNRLITFFSNDFRVFIVIMYFALYLIIYMFLIKESKIPWLSLFLFIAFDHFSFSLTVHRQFIAMVITMLTIKNIRKKNFMKFLITILIASMFHQSALVFFVVYPISKFKLDKYFYTLATSIALFIFAFGGRIISILLNIYDRQQVVVSGAGKNYFLMIFSITLFGIFIYHVYGSKVEKEIREETKIYIQIMVLAVILQVFSFYMSIFVRVVYYFSFYMIIFIPNLLTFIPKGYKRDTILTGLFFVCSVLFLYHLFANNYGVLPYQFFWQ